MIAFKCPKCNAALKTADKKAGRCSKCPNCGCPVQVPRQPGSIAAAVVTEVVPAEASSGTISAKSLGSGRSLPAQNQEESTANTGRKWHLLAIAGGSVLLLVLCCGGVLVGVVFRDRLKDHPVPNRSSVVSNDNPGRPAEQPPQQAAPEGGFVSADLRGIQNAYRGNEAAADATYLNKRVQFEFRPVRIDKEPSGYCAWSNQLGLPDDTIYGRHYRCHFGANHAATLANIKPGQTLTIRGVCAGKTGMERTSNGFVGTYGGWSSDPVIEFKDCEIVGVTENVQPQVNPPPNNMRTPQVQTQPERPLERPTIRGNPPSNLTPPISQDPRSRTSREEAEKEWKEIVRQVANQPKGAKERSKLYCQNREALRLWYKVQYRELTTLGAFDQARALQAMYLELQQLVHGQTAEWQAVVWEVLNPTNRFDSNRGVRYYWPNQIETIDGQTQLKSPLYDGLATQLFYSDPRGAGGIEFRQNYLLAKATDQQMRTLKRGDKIILKGKLYVPGATPPQRGRGFNLTGILQVDLVVNMIDPAIIVPKAEEKK